MEPKDFASALITELESLPVLKTAPMRKVRREFSKRLRSEGAGYVFEVAQAILDSGKHRWIAYELIRDHPAAFHSLDRNRLEALGHGMNSWSSVDSFSRTLSGPAWREERITMDTIRDWAQSEDRWWRRTALVSTVALNVRSHGGRGDVSHTLAICEMLIEDHDDMVVKALSWALRELVVHDPIAVDKFISSHDGVLAARVKREVRNKLETGLKNP
jgi:3-methyladenine DNA glycosylase AlkD